MNRDSFGNLSEMQQKAVLDAGQTLSVDAHAAWLGIADKSLAAFAATEGKEVITLAPEEAEKFDAASAPVVAEVIAQADKNGLEASAFVAALKSE